MKQITLKPDLQEISDRLPKLIRVIESQVTNGIQADLQRISEQIALKPDERAQIIKKHRETAVNRYNELINSGLRINATDEQQTLSIINLFMVAQNTWQIPLPKDVLFRSATPEPYSHIRAAIYPVYYQYSLIQACNELLTTGTSTRPKGKDEESKGKITLKEAALILVYRGTILYDPRSDPEREADRLAAGFGFESPTSGEQLFGEWKILSDPKGITGFQDHETRLIQNMIKRIEKIKPFLRKSDQQERADKDIQQLQMKIN